MAKGFTVKSLIEPKTGNKKENTPDWDYMMPLKNECVVRQLSSVFQVVVVHTPL